jgi:large subunit ribosomal protein L6
MSRIGKEPINIPQGVEVTMGEDNLIGIKGPKGELLRSIHPAIAVEIEQGKILVKRPNDQRLNKALHGLSRSLIYNMVEGVSQGYRRELEIIGVGYRAEMKGKNLMMSLGYSHPIIFAPPEGISIEIKDNLHLAVVGVDKELVGQCAAKIRSFRPPEPYKGKGVRYQGEYVARKAGKYAK